MKKQIVTYCPHCQQKAIHLLKDIKTYETTGERILSGIFTLGLSEFLREDTGIYQCEKCGNFKDLPKSWT